MSVFDRQTQNANAVIWKETLLGKKEPEYRTVKGIKVYSLSGGKITEAQSAIK